MQMIMCSTSRDLSPRTFDFCDLVNIILIIGICLRSTKKSLDRTASDAKRKWTLTKIPSHIWKSESGFTSARYPTAVLYPPKIGKYTCIQSLSELLPVDSLQQANAKLSLTTGQRQSPPSASATSASASLAWSDASSHMRGIWYPICQRL